MFGCKEDVAVEWCGLFSDELLRLTEESDLEDEDGEQERKSYYVHKYKDMESVIIGDKPFFIQMKEGSELDFNLLSEFPTSSRLLKPRDMDSYLCEPYVLKSEEDLRYYLKKASKFSTNLNFDPIFKLVKTIVKQYVVLEDHYITLVVADIIYSYFQDEFGTTHYDICVGDNGSGKNSILMVFGYLGYRVLLATSVSAANLFTFQGSVEPCQGTIAEDEIDNLDDNPEKLNIYKSGYSIGTSRIPKTDLSSGRIQEVFHTYCFKIFASESSLDNSKAKGLLDRSFIIPCLIGRPKYNIKEVNDDCKKYLRNELERTRKLLFACRMIHHKDIINDVNLNIINREAELTKPLIRLFHNSPEVLEELLPALNKCLDAKRKVKSTSLEAILYNLITDYAKTTDNQSTTEIDNPSLIELVRKAIDGKDVVGQQAFYCQDLGKVTHRKITDTLVDKFKVCEDHYRYW